MFIGRNHDGTIYGMWTSAQPSDADHPNIEEVPDDHPDVVAFTLPTTGNAAIVKQIAAVEASQPITQRSIRELMLAIGQAFPAAQASVFYQKAAAQETQVAGLRNQLR